MTTQTDEYTELTVEQFNYLRATTRAPQYNYRGVIHCTDCPHFNPDEAPCRHMLDGKSCPTLPEPQP